MLQIINQLRLSRTDSDEISVIEAKQGDNQGDICQIEIYDNQDIVDLSQFDDILFTANKPDKSSIVWRLSDKKNLIKNNNVLSLTLTSTLLSMHGTVECEISLYKGNIVKSTYNFNIYVFKSPGSFDELNNSDLSTIKEAVKTVVNIGDAAKISAENAKKSEENAKKSEDNALNSANMAEASANMANEKANEASASAIEAKKSEANAKDSEIASSNSESNALSSANAAKISEENSKDSENKANQSEINAKNSENVANNKAQESKDYALLSQSYAIGGTNSRENEDIDNAKYYSTQSKISSDSALNSASNACNSEQNCSTSETNALQYSQNAEDYKDDASNYASQASISASKASDKADIASNKATLASQSEQNALDYSNQAKQYKDKCLQIAQGLEGALIPMGTIAFNDLPIEDMRTGYMYNISDEFVSDERFKDGSGKTYPAGTNVYYTQDDRWDVLIGDMSKYVFKTDFEAHTNNKNNPHNVTKEDIGLGKVPNVITNDQIITYSDVDNLSTLSSGEKISTAFSKIKKAISDLISHLKDNVIHVTSDEKTLWTTVKDKADKSHTHSKSEIGLGNVDNTADVNKSVKYATSADKASKSTGVVDYNNPDRLIKIGFSGDGANVNNLKHLLGYISDTELKDVSKDVLKSWLGLGELAYSSATIPSVGNGTIYITQNSTVSRFTLNQSDDVSIYLTDTWRPQPDWNATSGDAAIKNKPNTFPPSAHTHTSLLANTDDRITNTTPNDYNKLMVISGLKENSAIGISTNYGTYSTVVGMRGWSDASGGDAHEMAFSATGEILHRHGATTTWNNWKRIAYTSDIPSSLPANGGTSDYANFINIVAGNEIRFNKNNYSPGDLFFGYCWSDGSKSPSLNNYIFGNMSGGGLANIKANEFIGSVAWNNITGKPSSLPASDVYSWAKASTKPSYSWSEISNKPSTFTPSDHTHRHLSAGSSTVWVSDNGSGIYSYDNTGFGSRSANKQSWTPVYASSYPGTSSKRYKTNIASITEERARKLLELNIVSYDYIEGQRTNDRERYNQVGVIAEEADSIIPEAVFYKYIDGIGNTPDSVDYSKFVPYLIKMVQIQQKEIDNLKEIIKG